MATEREKNNFISLDHMPSPRLIPASEISTHFRCDNCGILISKVLWKRCQLCKAFDLCGDCAGIPYEQLPRLTLDKHQKVHKDVPLTKDCLKSVSVEEAETEGVDMRRKRRGMEYERIVKGKKIQNDYEMAMVMNKLIRDDPPMDDQVNSLIVKYYLKASQRHTHVLSLDGGGVRGYMPIKVLAELITRKHLPHTGELNSNDPNYTESFLEAQKKFKKDFDYFVGTSTGGLIAFCVAVDKNILEMEDIYSDAGHYFKRNRLGPLIYSKYDPSVIHKKIDDIIDQIVFPGNKKISSKHATLLDIRNLLNPDNPIDGEKAQAEVYKHGNFQEFVDDANVEDTADASDEERGLQQIPREKVLLITAYNTTKNIITIFNTSYAEHWGYRIADVLKSTMAAPTYFPPYEVYKGDQLNGYFMPGKSSELFVDGGMFANDPGLAALWVIRMQWKKPANYHILSVGTGSYTSTLSSSTWGGYLGWIFNNGFLINTLMDATRSFTEIIGGNLAKFSNMRRMKLNYRITEAMALDDPDFVRVFDEEWQQLKNQPDFQAFLYFYDNYIADSA